MSKPIVETFDAPPDAVFAAVQNAAHQVGKSVDGVDSVNRTLYFNTGMSMWSWNGQNVTASVKDNGAGGSELHVEPQIKKAGMSSFQLTSWGEGGRVAKKLVKHVQQELAAGTASAPTV